MSVKNFDKHAALRAPWYRKVCWWIWLHVGNFTKIQKSYRQHTFEVLSSPTDSFTNIQKILHQLFFTNITIASETTITIKKLFHRPALRSGLYWLKKLTMIFNIKNGTTHCHCPGTKFMQIIIERVRYSLTNSELLDVF